MIMKIQFTIKSLENVPYKLVNLLDKTKTTKPRGIFLSNADLKLMIFESGEIVGISNKKELPPGSHQFSTIDESLVIGRAHENFVGSIVGPMIKLQIPRIAFTKAFAYANIKYLLEDEVTTGGFLGWTETYDGNKIERILDNIKSTKPSDALYRRIQQEPLLLSDDKLSEFVEEIEGKSEQLSKEIRYYKRYW